MTGHRVRSASVRLGAIKRLVTARRAMFAVAYSLLLVSCDSPVGPQAASVSRIEVSPLALSLIVGDARPLAARVVDDRGNTLSERRIFWASQNPAIASVSQAGIVTGVAPGSVQIAVSSGGKSAVVPVTVGSRPVSLVRVTPTAATVVSGATVVFAAQALDAAGGVVTGRTVLWTTNSAVIATVTSTGVVTGVSAGNANISATVDGVTGSGLVTVQPVPVNAVLVTPATGALIVGEQLQLTATPTDILGTSLPGRAISWSSNAPAVASVSSTGLVTALGLGSATVTATCEGKSATSRIAVSLVPVDAVSVTPSTASLPAGQSVQLTARPVDSTGAALTGRTVTWASDQPTIATVAQGGLVTAVSAGQARISATVDGKVGTATINVTPVAVASLVITPTSATLLVGKTQQFTVVTRDAQGNALIGRTVTWIEGAPTVATVTQTGLVTAVGPGSAIVFAASEGISTSVSVTVTTIGVARVVVQPAAGSINQGQTVQLTATAIDNSGQNIPGKVATWTSSNDAVASISSTGRVTGISPGQVTLTATIDGVVGTATLAVAQTPVASVTVTPNALTLAPGQSVGLTVALADAQGRPLPVSGRTISWSTSSASVVTVNSAGNITAIGPGTAVVTASTEGVSGTSTISVTSTPVATVTLSPASAALNQGQTQAVTATARDASGNVLTGRPVSWRSSNVAVATVNTGTTASANIISSVGTGTATISATIGAVQGVSTVTVTSVPIASLSVSPTPAALVAGQTQQLTVTARDASGNILTGRSFSFNSSAASVASVSSSGGLVTAVAPGTANIDIKPAGDSTPTATAVISVTAVPVASLVLNPSVASITVGTSQPLFGVQLFDASGNSLSPAGRTISWISLDLGIATVSALGMVTGVAASPTPARIVASTPGAAGVVSDTSTVTVGSVPVASVTITQGPNATVHVGSPYARTLTAVARDAGGNPLSATFTWTSDNQGVAQVGANSGVVTGVSTGSAVVTAIAGGVAGLANVTVDLVPISSANSTVALSPASQTDSVLAGSTRTYLATPRDSANNVIFNAALGGRTPTWSISAGSGFANVAPAGASATVTALSPGSSTVSADYGTASPTSTLKILVPVNNVIVTIAAPDSFFVGGTTQVTATAVDVGSAPIPGRLITLAPASASISLGTLSGSQSVTSIVTGVSAPGGRIPVVITATAPFDNRSNTATVKVLAPVNTISVSTPVDSFFVNQNVSAAAVLRDVSSNILVGRTVAWSTVAPLIATVDQSGVATGVAAGTTTVIAAAEGKTGAKSILVQEAVNSVSLTSARTGLLVTQTQQTMFALLDRFGAPLFGRTVSFSVNPPGVVTITASGLVSAVFPGTSAVTAVSEGKSSAPLTFVISPVPVVSVSMSAPDSSIFVGQTVQASVVAKDSVGGTLALAGRTVVWTSSNPAKASVSSGTSGGLITALGADTATIRVTVDGVGPTPGPIAFVSTLVPVANVSVVPSTKSLIVGDNFTFTATLTDASGNVLIGRPIVWTSNTAKASISNSAVGAVVAADSGAAVITATSEGKSNTASLSVSLVPVDTVTALPSSLTVPIGGSNSITFTAKTSGGTVLSGRAATIVSSDPGRASASPASALTDGSGRVVVTVNGVLSGSSNITVTIEGKANVVVITVP